MSTLRKAVQHFRNARATDRLFNFCGAHITKVHVYGVVIIGPVEEAFREGWTITGLGIIALMVLDLSGGND